MSNILFLILPTLSLTSQKLKSMGASLPTAESLCPSRAPEGVVFGPQVGAPVTSLSICEHGPCRGDILVGIADGTLQMLTVNPLPKRGAEAGSGRGDRGFKAQPLLPATDGSRTFRTAHAILPIVFGQNVHAIKGAYCDGKQIFTNIGIAGRSQGARVVHLPEIREFCKAEASSDEELKQLDPDIGSDDDMEAYGRRALEYDQYLFADINESYSLRSSTHILQYKKEVICLTAQRDGASIDCKTGQEYEIPQSYDDGDAVVGLDVRKRDVPTFFDGRRLVMMKTRGSVDSPRSKTRTVTVYGGWGGPYGARQQRRRARRRKHRHEKREKKKAEKDPTVASDNADNTATRTDDVQVYVHSPTSKQKHKFDPRDGYVSMEDTEEDEEDVDITRDIYVVAQFEWVMPESRVIWGFDLSDSRLISIHGDRTAKLWDLLDDEHKEPLGEAAMENGPAFVLRHDSRIHGYDFTQNGDLVSVCQGGVVYLWRAGLLFKK